jgi:hypothetical protein
VSERLETVGGLELELPPFEPHPLLRNPHLMNLSLLLPRLSRVGRGVERRFAVGGDGAVLGVCHWQPDRRAPAIVVTHGLTGSAASSYAVGIARKAFARGFHVVRLNARGAGGTEHLTRRLYHYGLTSDLDAVVRELIDRDGLERVYLVGYSMGGNQVLKLLGELGASVPAAIRGAVAVSPALDVAHCAHNVDTDRRLRFYRDYFVRRLKRMLVRQARAFPELPAPRDLRLLRTLREFDDRFTAPAWGFRDVDDYYVRASAVPVLGSVSVPCIVISARDDLLVPHGTTATATSGAGRRVRLVSTDLGGHCAFIASRPTAAGAVSDPDRYWAENRALQLFERLERDR